MHRIPGSSRCLRVPAALPAGWSCGSPLASAGPAAGAGSRQCWSCQGGSGRRKWGQWPTVVDRKDLNGLLLQLQSWSLNQKKKTRRFVFGNAALRKTWLWLWIISQWEGATFSIMCVLPSDVCCDRFACRVVAADAHVLTLNKNLLAQPLLDAAGVLYTHQQEQKLTIWFICCLGLGRWGSWLKAVGRKWLIRRGTHTHTHTSVTMVTTQRTSCLESAAMAVTVVLCHRLLSVWTIISILIININQHQQD